MSIAIVISKFFPTSDFYNVLARGLGQRFNFDEIGFTRGNIEIHLTDGATTGVIIRNKQFVRTIVILNISSRKRIKLTAIGFYQG